MRAPPPHQMVHEGTDATGKEEWRCPVCGRHLIVRWLPNYERLVLAEGDANASHVSSKGKVGFRGIQVAPASGEDAWRRWLRDHGIDWDGRES
jgi:hypothetical protein